MAAVIHDNALDAALDYIINNTENLYLCSQVPTTFTEASVTYKLATKASPSFGAKTNGDVSGRKTQIAAITDGVVNTAGNATHYALCDNSASLLLVTQALTSLKALVTGSPWTSPAFDIEIPDPT